MAYSVKAIANLIIDVGKANGSHVDQMKLQKLAYISHGWNLATTGEPLFEDDIQAWQYGPVIPDLYDEFRNCGRRQITDYATEVHVAEDDLSFSFSPPMVNQDDTSVIDLVNKVWSVYGKYTGPQLSNLTHMVNTPWHTVYKVRPKASIPNELIREHFVGLSQNLDD